MHNTGTPNTASTQGNASKIREHMKVVGSDGAPIGTVDRVEGDRIKLTKQDNTQGADQKHHFLPVSAVASVNDNEVRLNMSAQEAKRRATA